MSPSQPIVLWRLRGHGRDVRCLREATASGFELRVLWGRQLFLTEAFGEAARLLQRAEDFRQSLLARGWQPLPAGEEEPQSPEAGPPDDLVIGLTAGADAAAYLADLDRLSPPDVGRRPTVLVVDGDPAIRSVLRSRLEQNGYAVCVAGDVDAALDALDESAVDAVVLDARMPDPAGLNRSGLEVLTYLRLHAAFAALPVIVASAGPLDAGEQELVRRHRADVLVKPQGYGSLLQRLDELTGRGETTRP
jgi:CheY-like chemotaxis protein